MRLTPSLSVLSTVLLAALALAPATAQAADMRGVRLMENDEGTRAVIDLSGPPDYKVFTLHNPERMVLDLRGANLDGAYGRPPLNGMVTDVRTGRPTPDTLRVVFDLGAAATTQSRIEGSGAQTRLVIDLRQAGTPGKTETRAPETAVAVMTPVTPAAPDVAIPPAAKIDAPVLLPSAPTPVASQAPVAPVPAPHTSRVPPTRTVRDVIGSGQRKLVVAIDAGHGGKDPGASGPSGLREKVVTLAVARELAKQIDADPGMKAVLIRDGDSFVVLQDRYQKARAAQADLFISIHADAAQNSAASGASVYVLSTRGASSQAARWLADQENAADLVGGVQLDGRDHNLASVLFDLSQSATMRASDDVAGQVLASLKNVGKAHKSGVERANFVVLRSPDVPSMLVETGFITNPGEEKNLGNPDYRKRLANAITSGVRQYFSDQPPPGTWYAARQAQGTEPGMLAVADTRESGGGRQGARQHVVSRGETLTLIAAQHGVAVDTIREANHKRNDRVRVGERLRIPLMASLPQ